MRTFDTELTVRYGETDKMGVVHHSNYLLWFELGRTGLLREAGYAYSDLERGGFLLPVLEYNCKFHKGAEYDDSVLVNTVVSDIRSRAVTFHYECWRNDTLLCTGWTRHVCVDHDNNIQRIPDGVVEACRAYLRDGG